VFANYTLASLQNNTDGPFGVPPTGDLATEWGPAAGGTALGGPGPGVPGVVVFGGAAGATDIRSRLNLAVNNITNEKNYLGHSGTLTSPFFGRPTAVSGMRKIDAGMSLSF
jgi:hypothetical protein